MNRRQRASLLQKFVHFLAALGILLKALVKMEHPQGYWPVIVLFLVSAIVIVILTLLHERLHHHARLLDAGVYAIECVVVGIVAWLYFVEGARMLPWVHAAASAGFGIATIVRLLKRPAPSV